ncbi:carboxylesterase type B [Neocallimastix lanati (nom. inval.)]|nr:carboxylesterase type B [Neocallimastix sp. JGI-2020a]
MKTINIFLLVLFSILYINISKAKAIKETESEWNTDIAEEDVIDVEEDYVKSFEGVEEVSSYKAVPEEETEIVEEEEVSDLLLRETTYGPVIGNSENNDKVLVWYNIPYASAPVGKLRWEAPVDPKPWKEALNCTAPGEIALQMSDDKVVGTEDCLNLDVYSTPKAKKLPVMVYIHGGNNQTGHSRELIGNEIVLRNNCIYISINYRLGIFGFNSLPALHTKKGSTGNYALLDMAKALDWIKENAERFGGDSDNITITGFSAGGRDVMAMLISPLFTNKFHKAIVFSGGMTVADVDDSVKRTASVLAPLAVEDKVASSEAKAKEWLMTDSKEVKEWLYSVSSERLVSLMGNAGIRMSVFPHLFNDDVVIPKEGFSTTKWNSVPVIMLTGSTEFSFFNFGASIWYIPTAFEAGPKDQTAANDFSVHYGSEMYRIFNAQSSAEKMFDQYKDDIYLCQVDFGSEYSDYVIPGVGSFHGVFIPMLASEHGYAGMYDFKSEAYQAMATVFNKQLKSFLEDGNPNGEDLPFWKKWTPKHPVSMVLDAIDNKSSAQCKDVSTSFEKLIAEMEADTSVTEQGKSLVISKVLNGRWFSEPLDQHFKNPSLWK